MTIFVLCNELHAAYESHSNHLPHHPFSLTKLTSTRFLAVSFNALSVCSWFYSTFGFVVFILSYRIYPAKPEWSLSYSTKVTCFFRNRFESHCRCITLLLLFFPSSVFVTHQLDIFCFFLFRAENIQLLQHLLHKQNIASQQYANNTLEDFSVLQDYRYHFDRYNFGTLHQYALNKTNALNHFMFIKRKQIFPPKLYL